MKNGSMNEILGGNNYYPEVFKKNDKNVACLNNYNQVHTSAATATTD